jgi:soluble lytic murein transglycosylase-like protein
MDRQKSISIWMISADKVKTNKLDKAPRYLIIKDTMRSRISGCNILLFIVLQAFLTGIFLYQPVYADIYRYEDSEGIVHFTDAPTDKRFIIFMRDIKRDKQLRTRLNLSCAVNPAEYDQLIRTCSDKYGVNASLIKAVIHAESGYNPNAVSHKGASGLMQLMPGTAKSLKVSNSFDPKDNVEGGVKYLRFLLDTFHGDVSLALAAYNAGLSKVAKFGGIPPYAETRTYVNRVLSYMQSYQAKN